MQREGTEQLDPARPEVEAGRGRPIRVDETTAWALGVGVGGVVELVNPRGAPLRAWVVALLPGNGRLADGSEVEVRAVHSGILEA